MKFTFQQALFGYDGGHQLLAASLRLPSDARHLLSTATDLSGSPPPNGFQQTYTGMVLPETTFYALFSTWLAPEMPRPGCVWSHVLLIDLVSIAELRDLGRLRRLFRQPLLTPSLGDFSVPVDYVEGLDDPSGLVIRDDHLATQLLIALYEEATKLLVVPASSETAHEEMIFALWSQQWPRLRRNFCFSTGSFADRGRRGPPFDVQVTPVANLSSWRGEGVHVLVGRDMQRTPQTVRSQELWYHSALNDLLYPDAHGFRKFLRNYGADVNVLRGAFIPLARMYGKLSSGNAEPWISTLQILATDFPAAEEARTLKTECISRWPYLSAEPLLDRLMDTIRFLCHEDTKGAFAQVNFDFTKAVADLWPRRREALLATLTKPPLSETCRTALAKAVADSVSADEVPLLWNTHPELLVMLVRLNPNLAATPTVWRLPERGQWSAVEALEAIPVSQVLWRKIVRAMLTAGSTVGAQEITHRASAAALDEALDWLVDASSADLPPSFWREVLCPLAEERLAGGMLSPSELAFCAAIVPPTIAARLSATRADMQTLASKPLETLPTSLRLRTAFLLVAVGLQASEETGAPLLARGLFAVHEALESATEPPEAWRLLQPYLPVLWYWQEWDHCEKLRRALANWLRAYPNAFKTILAAARNPDERKLVERLRISVR